MLFTQSLEKSHNKCYGHVKLHPKLKSQFTCFHLFNSYPFNNFIYWYFDSEVISYKQCCCLVNTKSNDLLEYKKKETVYKL